MNKIIVILSLFLFQIVVGQDKNEKLSIYAFKHRYGNKGVDYIERNKKIIPIKLLGGYMIDPNKNGEFDMKSVKKHLKRLYPKKDEKGTLCINVETDHYQTLKSDNTGSEEFKAAEKAFVNLIKTIKAYRPNVKFGIYGLPFRVFDVSNKKRLDDSKKLDSILSKVDYIFPSLYTYYPAISEKNKTKNSQYWKKNLDQAFGYADRFGKPVIPFVWYIIYPGNNDFGGELMGKGAMDEYLTNIQEYASGQNCKVGGVVWWESSKKYFNKHVKPSSYTSEDTSLQNDIILKEYIDFYFNKQ